MITNQILNTMGTISKSLEECLLEVFNNKSNPLPWSWINDNGEGCQSAIKDNYIVLIEQPRDEFTGSINSLPQLTVKGREFLKSLKEISFTFLVNGVGFNFVILTTLNSFQIISKDFDDIVVYEGYIIDSILYTQKVAFEIVFFRDFLVKRALLSINKIKGTKIKIF